MISARDMSQRYAAYLHTQLIGDETEAVDFGLWLDQHWADNPALPDEPCLDDIDGEAEPGSAVTWFERDGAIIGLLAGRNRGCYRIPLTGTPPAVALFADDALECSTGSVLQERAFALGRDEAPRLPVSISVFSLRDERSPQTQSPPLNSPPPITAEVTSDASFGGLPG